MKEAKKDHENDSKKAQKKFIFRVKKVCKKTQKEEQKHDCRVHELSTG